MESIRHAELNSSDCPSSQTAQGPKAILAAPSDTTQRQRTKKLSLNSADKDCSVATSFA